ncbi:Lrp/AsnC ligand binding domain-containing protein [Mucilaginibacter aquaedulcis]|uniref:Lrp/AsnC ligand binding domain-containing protein n=1 Tax=Mucilaginibacter aquaedulcis TaxID=1187081 RepID=UPI0025B4C948|nr:Lrp/AsnC ligand binding domain-containing protein [Mucilaginibacter aquaedulcis]MDN3548354.1 Lrp/AsnC ligand binding domain-containing protein [Mucilaginibacter aquaedulcis]
MVYIIKNEVISRNLSNESLNKINILLVDRNWVYLIEHSQEALAGFQREFVKLPEVLGCYHMTGVFDFLLLIAISDMDDYNVLLMTKLSKLPDVGNMQSFFVLSVAKEGTAFPLIL